MLGGKGPGTCIKFAIPSAFQNKGDSTLIDTRNISANLFHTLSRCVLVGDCWKPAYTLVWLDSNPIAIPFSLLDVYEKGQLSDAGLKFTMNIKPENDADRSQDLGTVSFAMNPVLCTHLLKTTLTVGGSVLLDEAVQEDMVITCDLLHLFLYRLLQPCIARAPFVRGVILMYRVESVAEGLKAASRSLLNRINEWSDHWCTIARLITSS